MCVSGWDGIAGQDTKRTAKDWQGGLQHMAPPYSVPIMPSSKHMHTKTIAVICPPRWSL